MFATPTGLGIGAPPAAPPSAASMAPPQPPSSANSTATRENLPKGYEDLEPLEEVFKWANISAPGMVYRGDIVKMLQKLIGLCVWETFSRKEGFKPATRFPLVELEFRRIAEDLVHRRGYFGNERFTPFFENYVRQYLTFERGRAVPIGALLSTKYPQRGEALVLKEGSKVWNDAYDTRRQLVSQLIPALEKKLVKGQPPQGKTWEDVLEEVRTDMWLEKLSKNGDKDQRAANVPDDDWVPSLAWLAFILFGQYGRARYGTHLTCLASVIGDDDEASFVRPVGDSESVKRTRLSMEPAPPPSSDNLPAPLSAAMQRYVSDSKNIRTLIKATMKLLEWPNLPQESRDALYQRLSTYQLKLEECIQNAPDKSLLPSLAAAAASSSSSSAATGRS